MKTFLSIFLLLILGSLLCFYPSEIKGLRDWTLFLIIFFTILTGFFLFFRSSVRTIRTKRTKKRIEQTSFYETLLEAMILFDSKGKILYMNQKARYFFNLIEAKVEGKGLLEFQNPSYLMKKSCELLLKCQKTGQIQNISMSLEEKKPSSHLIVRPLLHPQRYVLFFQDSYGQTQTHQMEKDFIANASHELRTPITIIKGFAETLIEMPKISESMLQDFTEKIIRNCQRIELLVKNLLTLTDLDSLIPLRLQECNLVALIDSCVYTLLSIYPNSNIETLQNQEVISILGDPNLLELALMNLLENGIKYSLKPAQLTITLEHCSNEVRLTIADKGMGIPTEDLDHIFERFYTVDKAHSRQLGGAGLGLSIVKAILSKHNAQILVFSKIGKGTNFTLVFEKISEPLFNVT